jgi:hypothetical protein
MKKSLTAAFIVAALSLSACGGGDDRPSKDELAKQLTSKDNGLGAALTKKQANCVAQAILDSKISDEGMKALAKGDKDYKPSKADIKAQADVTDDVTKCVAP